MTGRWIKKSIGNLCDLGGGEVRTGPFGSQLHQSDYSDEGTPVVMPTDILGDVISEKRIARVSKFHLDRLTKYKLSKGDIVYGRRGDIGRQTLVRDSQVGWLCGTGCLRIKLGNSEVIPEYLHLYLKMPEIITWIQNQAIGATMLNLNTKILRRVPIHYPRSKEVQRKVVGLIFAYNDLIENNKRRIALLEKMAEEIYREWFVRMRFPGHEKVKFVKGIPEGWEVVSLSSLGDYLNGYPFRPTDWYSDGIPIIKIKEMTSGISSNTPRNNGENIKEKYYFYDGDIIFSWSATLLVCIWDQGPGLVNQHLFKVTPAKGISRSFLYFSIKFSLEIFNSLTTGATMKHIKRKELDFVKVNFPPKELLFKFDKNVSSILDSKLNLTKTNRNLCYTRDNLLPRLISGKLSVENLDIQFPPSMKEDIAPDKTENTHA